MKYIVVMKYAQLEQKTQAVIDEWLQDLDNYTIEQLLQKPAENSWSVAQVYVHLWMASKGIFFKNIERIVNGDERTKKGGRKNFAGWMVFTFGRMPSVKIEMPSSVSVQPNQPDSKETLVKRLEEVKRLVTDSILRLQNAPEDVRVKHPFLGWLTAQEWMQLCAIHFSHHRAQKQRIKKHFGW